MVRRGQLVSRKLFKPFLFLWTRRTHNWKPQPILSAKTPNISCSMSQNKLSYSFSRKKYVQNVFLDIQISFIILVGNVLMKVGSFVAEVGNKHGNVKFAKTFFSSFFFLDKSNAYLTNLPRTFRQRKKSLSESETKFRFVSLFQKKAQYHKMFLWRGRIQTWQPVGKTLVLFFRKRRERFRIKQCTWLCY